MLQYQYNARSRRKQHLRARRLEISLIELAGGTVLVCLHGRLRPEAVEKLLRRHAEYVETESGIVAVVHLPIEAVRPFLQRLEGNRVSVGFLSPDRRTLGARHAHSPA